MFKSKLFIKSMFVIMLLIIGYVVVISIFVIPKIESSFYSLEEKNT